MNFALPIAAIALVGGAFIGGYRFEQWHAVPEYPLYRGTAILRQASMIPSGGVLFIGDSIVDQAYLPTLCDVPVLNAGMSGATVADLIPIALDAIKLAKPSRVLISVGINNALPKSKDVSVENYSQQLDLIISAALATGAKVGLMTQTAVCRDEAFGLELSKLKAIDAAIRQMAQRRHVQIIDASIALAGPNGEMPAASTIDGVHLTAAGYFIWNSKIQREVCHPDVL